MKKFTFFFRWTKQGKTRCRLCLFSKKRISNILSHYDINTMITKGNTLKFKSILHEIMEYC